ncbi:hypothetical protein [Enterovirga rhinocerotis]|uniref:hypothetical protein n=1 Tax=Enterovirga rhinocerotis TaxID=1339210 RepID=UPI0010604FF4|nr:hypothetical protein [Enterovirga rhinocerotis]
MSTPLEALRGLEQLVEEAYWSAHVAAIMVERCLQGERGPNDEFVCRIPKEDSGATAWIVYDAQNRAMALRDAYFAAIEGGAP